jgi:polyisoprenoid-binding protein YceI
MGEDMKKAFILAALAVCLTSVAFGQSATYQIDPAHSNAQFVVRHLGISNVQGQFTKISGTVQLDEAEVTKSTVSATIEVNSLDTRVAARDKDVLSEKFFDAAKFANMTFQSKKITRGEGGKLKMTGDLTIHGVTREVTFDVDGPTAAIKDPWGNNRRGVSATTKITRQDFGLTYNSALPSGELVVGDSVAITLDIEIIRKP